MIANKWEECVQNHDAEGLSVLPFVGLPLMAAAEKHRYVQVPMQCIDNDIYDHDDLHGCTLAPQYSQS